MIVCVSFFPQWDESKGGYVNVGNTTERDDLEAVYRISAQRASSRCVPHLVIKISAVSLYGSCDKSQICRESCLPMLAISLSLQLICANAGALGNVAGVDSMRHSRRTGGGTAPLTEVPWSSRCSRRRRGPPRPKGGRWSVSCQESRWVLQRNPSQNTEQRCCS